MLLFLQTKSEDKSIYCINTVGSTRNNNNNRIEQRLIYQRWDQVPRRSIFEHNYKVDIPEVGSCATEE
jgi:hypothetical protein